MVLKLLAFATLGLTLVVPPEGRYERLATRNISGIEGRGEDAGEAYEGLRGRADNWDEGRWRLLSNYPGGEGSSGGAGAQGGGQPAPNAPAPAPNAPAAAPQFNFQTFVAGGQQALTYISTVPARFRTPQEQLSVTEHYGYAGLGGSGWVETTKLLDGQQLPVTWNNAGGPVPLGSAYTALKVPKKSSHEGKNGPQWVSWKRAATVMEVTSVYHHDVGGNAHAVTAISDIAHNAPGTAISTWAQVSFLEFAELMVKEQENPNRLRYVFQMRTTDKDTLKVIEHVQVGHVAPPFATAQAHSLTTNEGKALLGTPVGLQIANLLIENPHTFDPRAAKTVLSVRIFTNDDGVTASGGQPALLLELGVDKANKVAARWRGGQEYASILAQFKASLGGGSNVASGSGTSGH